MLLGDYGQVYLSFVYDLLRVHQKYAHTVKDQFLLTRLFTIEEEMEGQSLSSIIPLAVP